jgi:pyridinium-3,5-biscarboxylic acid mononucleotide sulfurtransferase
MTSIDDDIQEIRERVEGAIGRLGSAIIGFSAGVDSSVVAAAANAVLGANALAVTAVTETITEEDLLLAEEISSRLGMRHELIRYNELEIDGYAANPSNRCYYCKDALYSRLAELARARGIASVLDGTNADDVGDYRPGRQAAREQGVRSPLMELGVTKSQVRRLAASYGLPNHDKPSAPCLSSRVPYGTSITIEVLRQIGHAERSLRALGFTELRVRHHGDVARIELPPSELARAASIAADIDEAVRGAGYRYVALDLRGFRSGSLNESLTQIEMPTR